VSGSSLRDVADSSDSEFDTPADWAPPLRRGEEPRTALEQVVATRQSAYLYSL